MKIPREKLKESKTAVSDGHKIDISTKIIGNNVAEIRDAIGLSQKDFATLAGIFRATLTNIERGNK